MRQTTTGGITLDYPDALVMAYNPVMFHIASGIEAMKISLTANGKTYAMTADAIDGEAWADTQQYIQVLFSPQVTGEVDYNNLDGASTTFMAVTGSIEAVIDENTSVTFSVAFSAVWGALSTQPNDAFNGFRRVTWFRNYPFSFGAYIPSGSTSIQVGTNSVNINAEGIYDFVPIDNGSDVMPVIDLGGVVQQGVFDGTFDITFMAISGGGNPNRLGTIDIDREHNEGIYLRWIDRHGFTAYWLFKVGDEQHTITQIIAASRANYAAYRERYGFTGNAGERGACSRADVVPLCVPLVDKTTWEYLQDVASSPVVDMFAGMDPNNDPIWVEVSVQAATYTKTRDELQDFTINLLPPQTPVQRL